MQMGYALFFVLFPIFLKGCCVRNHQKKKTGLKQTTLHQHYRAVEGEIFMMPCISSVNEHWEQTRTREDGEDDKGSSFGCGKAFLVEVTHSGNYTRRTGSPLTIHLQVLEKNSIGCFQPEESSAILVTGVGGKILCPGHNCSDNSNVVWYKGKKAMSECRRKSCEEGGLLKLCPVSNHDTEVFFCDRQIREQGLSWIFRRAVNVTAIPAPKSEPPSIRCPDGNITVEVELGRPHTLMCKAYFPYEIKFSPKVWWHINDGGNMENMTLLHMKNEYNRVIHEEYEVVRRAIIEEVTPQYLNHTYTCRASNSFGSSSVTVKLKRRNKVKWPCLVGYPVASFLLVAGLGIILHVKWLELKLIYRSHLYYGKPHLPVEKEFDVFLSYVWSPSSVEGLSLSFTSGPCNDKEGAPCLSSINHDEGKATCRSLEVLLPHVLENQWGYRLCLLERDILPGGAYTNDVVLALKRSRMLICVLSADYLSNSDAVFVLESGIQALLQKPSLKLLLIWTNRASASRIRPEPPLPTLVHRALKVLPSLDWSTNQPAGTARKFWRSLKKAMVKRRE
ncbi:interleukin-18 receptor accessory protein-like isoform X2 [Mugil cephalus]|uniref:interleukin-18 receptor accessory protein-like isoform X2 n=1 Tax=Mugil cephalus TaxID=48193 RepID=UPI001FB6FFC2|nr:interleukin-18 receptor accessory protein-like isoform X2 [Mugil cephalus]